MSDFPAPLFISLGPEVVWGLLLVGVVWLAFVALQISMGVFAVRAALRHRWLWAGVWGVVFAVLIGAVPLWTWMELRGAEAAMARAQIVREVPDFTGKDVLYVPSRGLDDPALSCEALVSLSGARAVWLTERWVAAGQPEGAPQVAADAAVDLIGMIEGRAVLRDTDYGTVNCVLEKAPAPDMIDYVLVESQNAQISAGFRDHLEAVGALPRDNPVRLVYFIGAVADPRAFEMSQKTALIALFETYADEVRFPYQVFTDGFYRAVPRDRMEFDRVIRQVVCREAADAAKRTCRPFT